MKKAISFILLMLLLGNSVSAQSNYNLTLQNQQGYIVARVTEIIDGEIYKVSIGTTITKDNQVIIRLIGVDTESTQEAFDYALNNLLGKVVLLTKDKNDALLPSDPNKWNQVYLYIDLSKSFNVHLVEQGLAKVNTSYSKAEQYTHLKQAEAYAESMHLGFWERSDYEQVSKVNINTASYEQLETLLEDTTGYMASQIVSHRTRAPFYRIEDIKFVDDAFDFEWFNKNKNKLSVVTNLQKTTQDEIKTLLPSYSMYYSEAVRALENHLIFNDTIKLDDLKKIESLKRDFDYFEPFITLSNSLTLPRTKTININTASVEEIVKASNLSTFTAERIVKVRENTNYIYKNLYEIVHFSTGLTTFDLLYLRDNFTTLTSINTAPKSELKSLFSSIELSDGIKDILAQRIIDARPIYTHKELENAIMLPRYFEAIKPFVTLNMEDIQAYNINLTDKDYLIKVLNLSTAESNQFKQMNTIYRNTTGLPFSYTNNKASFSFYTDINSASRDVLYRLDEDMTFTLVDAIIAFRKEQPFTSLPEVQHVFNANNASTIYNRIKDFIIFY